MATVVGAVLLGASLAPPAAAQAQTGTITGRVVDSTSQQPLANVTVQVVGTQFGTQTREDGRYTVAGVPAGARTIRATRIGYTPGTRDVTITAGGTTTVDFVLGASATRLTEVVVTGYGTQRREAITGSVATVDADEANIGVVANPNQLLQGRVAGVNMVQNNGEPGGGVQIRIRGGTSLSASNDPLYVVDGVPLQNEATVAQARGVGGINPALSRSPLNTINPNDIESITVLKDAAATAIYGSRGANGVILITTKGGAEGTSTIEYDTYVSMSMPARTLDFLDGNQYRSFVEQQVGLYVQDSLAGVPVAERRGIVPERLENLGDANTNWVDELTRRGYGTNHNLAFSGGTATTQYRASINYFQQSGVVRSNGLRRYQGRLNGQHQAFDGRLNVGLNLTASRVYNDYLPFENTGGFEGGVFTNMAIFNPTRPVTTTNAAGDQVYYEVGAGSQSVRNPVALAEQVDDQAPENRVLGNLTASLTLLPGLVAQTTIGADYTDAVRQTYFPRTNPIGAQFSGLARQAQRSLQNINFQQLLTYTADLGGTHEFDVVGGYEFSEFENQGFEVVMQGFITDAFSWNNLGAGNQANSPVPGSYLQESRLASFFSRANYGFAGRFFLTGVVRYDGSSRLAEGNQWELFPAVSASWRLSQEGFMQDRPLGLSTLALRAGWGRQGNQAVRPYATQLLLRADNGARYPFGGVVTTGLVAGQVANPNLTWETSEQVNVGLDYGFADDRFTGILEFYQKTTEDLLLDVSVPQPAVVSTRVENIGSIRSRGVELTLDGELWSDGDRSFSAGLVAAVERNEVVSLGADRTFINTGSVSGQGQSGRVAQRLIVGEPIGTFWGPRFLRVEDGHQLFACTPTTGRTDCVNGATMTPLGADEEIIGNANPDFSLGLRSNGRWGRFDASWLWRAEIGRDVFNNTALVYQSTSNVLADRNFLADALAMPDVVGEPAVYSSRWIEDGSFVRLESMEIGYSFNLPGRLAGSATRVYLSGNNLLLFTGYSGSDPEVFVDAGLATRGIDYLAYPRARTFSLGASVRF